MQAHSQRLAWLETARHAGRRWRSYSSLIAVAAAAVIAVIVFPDLPLRQGYAGFLLGGIGVLVVIGLVGLTNPVLDGRFATRWSIDALRRVRGWHVVDNLPFEQAYVDHVVVSPSAVLAVETKYHGRALPASAAEAARHRRDLEAAERAAHKVRLYLRSQNLRDAAVVVPVLMVWGPGAPSLDTGHQVDDGVHVVDGNHPEHWMHVFNTPRLGTSTRRDVAVNLERYTTEHAKREAKSQPSLRSQLWQEFRGGITHERATRAAHRERARQLKRRNGLRVVAPAPVAITPPPAAESA